MKKNVIRGYECRKDSDVVISSGDSIYSVDVSMWIVERDGICCFAGKKKDCEYWAKRWEKVWNGEREFKVRVQVEGKGDRLTEGKLGRQNVIQK